ncbi:hypothetical protein N869_00355 [Cellulomonas bogoriensis 69B4 = DSM 16987]|uniref:Uncharacterized protein n=1 Tax=Cellulomonas bogoriensis 69B4 = DSM 16987 TaxID=1386082 RepID=A0A0A0BQM6_9CELL|nr:hypothetical protein N869_00355 [Cellulomonas bogoriensis 69B4 = DSM 16987]
MPASHTQMASHPASGSSRQGPWPSVSHGGTGSEGCSTGGVPGWVLPGQFHQGYLVYFLLLSHLPCFFAQWAAQSAAQSAAALSSQLEDFFFFFSQWADQSVLVLWSQLEDFFLRSQWAAQAEEWESLSPQPVAGTAAVAGDAPSVTRAAIPTAAAVVRTRVRMGFLVGRQDVPRTLDEKMLEWGKSDTGALVLWKNGAPVRFE